MPKKEEECCICKKKFPEIRGTKIQKLEPTLKKELKKQFSNLKEDDFLCFSDMFKQQIDILLQQELSEKKEVAKIQKNIFNELKDGHLVTKQMEQPENTHLTFGQKLADGIAKFGGSWSFILSFIFILIFWIFLNFTQVFFKAFDPYPFILLNLVLSCLAAVQAPIIMMSQNRQEERDRQQAKNDYKTNLTAEIEVRLLHKKIDILMNEQIAKIVEMEQLQLQMIENIQEELQEMREESK